MERNILMDAKTKKVSTSNSNLISTPLIMIDSISIDLVNETEKIEMGNCKHFSIRGYVAEMCIKDKKVCWPFPIDNKQNKPEDHICTLPPLQTTKFKWWRCENCRREMDPQCTSNDIVKTPIGNGDGVISCADKSEKDDEVACSTGIGHVKNSKDDANQKISRPKSVAEKIDLCLKPGSCTVPLEPKCNGALVDTGKSDCGINEASANELRITKLNCQVKQQDIVSNGHASAHLFLNSDKHDCGPSVNDETLAENDLIDDFDEDTSVSHRQKPRKIRLLSDLLEATCSAKADHNTANSDSLSDSQRRGWDKVLNVGNEFKDKSKKRKMGHDENGTLLEMSPFNSENRKSTISLGGSKSNYKELDRHHLDKSAMKKRDGDDQNHILKKKKQDVGNADVASSHQISTDRVIEPVLQNIFPVQESGTKSGLCKKKNRKPQVENFQTVLTPWNYELLRKNSIIRQNVENKQTRPKAQTPIFSYEDFLATQQSKRNVTHFFERQPDFVLPKMKDIGSKYIGESSGPYKSTESTFHDKAVRQDLGIKTGPRVKLLVSEKLIGPSRAEEQDLSTSQKMGVLGKRNSEEGIELKAQGGQRVDKLSEQRATDDIPMDIVELLAKNQFERRLQSAEKIPSPFQTSHKPKNGEKVIVNNVRLSGEIKFSQMEKVQLAKLQPDIARKNIFAIDENVQWTNQKPVSNFPHMSLQEGSYISNGLRAFSSGVQQSAATSSSKQVGGAHTSYWSSLLHNQLSHKDQACPLQNGKMNGNRVPKPFDLNVASTEKQNPNLGSQSKIYGEYRHGCNNGMGLSPNLFESKGLYSNDTIPAMHLLSLMDPGMRSITPPFHAHENNKFLKAPQFLQDRHLSSSVDYRKYPISEISCDCAFTSSLRNDIETLTSHRKEKAKRPHSPKRSTILMSQEYTKTNSGLPTNFECCHGKVPQRLTSSDPNLQRPTNFQCSHGIIPQILTISNPNLQSSCEIVCPVKKSPNLEICVVNRNPADFTTPGPGKFYMIGPEDLKFSDEYELTNTNGHKIQRPQELSTIEKQSHNQISCSF